MIGGEGDEASMISGLYLHGSVSVSSLGYFLSVGSSYKPSRYSLNLSFKY